VKRAQRTELSRSRHSSHEASGHLRGERGSALQGRCARRHSARASARWLFARARAGGGRGGGVSRVLLMAHRLCCCGDSRDVCALDGKGTEGDLRVWRGRARERRKGASARAWARRV
jgi:hypothetical protein